MPFPTYEKKTEIPAGADDVYEEKDGKWVPKVPDTSRLEETLTKVRSEKKQIEDRFKTADDARQAAERERDTLKTQVGDPEGKTAKLLEQWKKEREEAVKAANDEIAKLKGELDKVTVEQAARDAFVKSGGRAERADAALALTRGRLERGEGGAVVVKDANGNPTTLTLEKFYGEEFKTATPEFFKGTLAGGGGAGGINGGTPGAAGSLTADAILQNPSLAFDAANAKASA